MTNFLKTSNLKNAYKMGKLEIVLLVVLFLIPLAFAEPSYTFKKNADIDLKISCFDIANDLCNTAVSCALTVHYPNLTGLYSNVSMTQSANLDYFNYTLTGLSQTGEYPTIVRCIGNTTGFSTFTFEVTSTGRPAYSILDNPVLILFGIMALVLIAMGAYFSTPWFGFIGAIMFLMGGIYTMIFGFNNVTDLYTQSVGLTFIGLGFIFMFLAAYEWIWGAAYDN